MTPLLSSTLLRTQSDARLAGLAADGHERAFEAIVERYRRPLHRWCRRVLPEARAEDAVQATFLKAWTALQAGTAVGELRPWLYRIARNAALDNARKAGYDYDELTEALRVAPGPETDFERRRVIRETLAGVAGLPENQRDALLHTAAGHSRAEIARELDISQGAVRQLVHRARITLRAAATAVTPLPLASWAANLGPEAGGPTAQRIAELAAGAGSAGVASAAIKTGTVLVAAGVIAAGPGSDLRQEVSNSSRAAAAGPVGQDGQQGDAAAGSTGNQGAGQTGSGSGYSGVAWTRRNGGGGDSGNSGRHGSGRNGQTDGTSKTSDGRRGSDDSTSGSGDGHHTSGDRRGPGSGDSGSGSTDHSGSGSGTDDHPGAGSGGDKSVPSPEGDSSGHGSGTPSGSSGSEPPDPPEAPRADDPPHDLVPHD